MVQPPSDQPNKTRDYVNTQPLFTCRWRQRGGRINLTSLSARFCIHVNYKNQGNHYDTEENR